MGLGKKILKIIKMEHHSDRKNIAGEMPFGDFGQLVALIIFMVVWILDSFIFKFSTFLIKYDPFFLRLLFTFIFLGISLYCTKSGLKIVFQEVRDPPQLITKGIFKISRHPIYLGAILAYLSIIILTFSLISLCNFIVICIFYEMLANYEEKLLLDLYGQMFERYRKAVPKWFSLMNLIELIKKRE